MGGSDTANLGVVTTGLALVVSPPVGLRQFGEVMLDLAGPGSRQGSLLNSRVEQSQSLIHCVVSMCVIVSPLNIELPHSQLVLAGQLSEEQTELVLSRDRLVC